MRVHKYLVGKYNVIKEDYNCMGSNYNSKSNKNIFLKLKLNLLSCHVNYGFRIVNERFPNCGMFFRLMYWNLT